MPKVCPNCGFSLHANYGYRVCNICGWWTEAENEITPIAQINQNTSAEFTENTLKHDEAETTVS